MSARVTVRGGWWDSPILARLTDGRRRQTLAILLEWNTSVEEQDLATHLVATEEEKPLVDVTKGEVKPVCIELRHSHLPALDDADFIIWDRAEATISTTDHPALYDPRLRYILDQQSSTWDEVMPHLVVERRRIALSILETRDEPVPTSTLAREIAAREGEIDSSLDPVDHVLVSLHHVHLPKLQAVGLLEYNVDDETVAYCGHPDLEETWFDVRPNETRRRGLHSSQQ